MLDPTLALRIWAGSRRRALARQDAAATQRRVLASLLGQAQATAFGRTHDFAAIRSVEEYQRRVPLRTYDSFWQDWWRTRFPRLDDVTWPGRIRYFANSSGTTQGATKRIPLTLAMIRANRGAALDTLAWHFAARAESRMLAGRGVYLGGSTALETLAPGIHAGDLSAIAQVEQPWWARSRVLPPPAMSRMTDWRAKMAELAPLALASRVTSISGTASWILLFFETAAAMRGGARVRELFPALELVVYGGVGFAPYRDRFAYWLDGSRALLREVYVASEGFVAVADRGAGEGMRMVLDRGVFYEFVRPSELGSATPERRWLGDAALDEDYALVLTTNSGLWSYVIGDTVRLVSRDPPRLLVTGRTSWSLSVAGEHLIGSELDAALAAAARAVGRGLVEYSAAPVMPDTQDGRAGHLFAVELDGPADAAAFAEALDAALKRANEDYAAHRGGDFGLRPPDIRLLPPGAFARWMERRGKLGAQNKVPRVVAGREALSGLLEAPDE